MDNPRRVLQQESTSVPGPQPNRLHDAAFNVAEMLTKCFYNYPAGKKFTGGVPRHVFEKELLDGLLDGVDLCSQHPPGERVPVYRDFLCQPCFQSKTLGTCCNHSDRKMYIQALCRPCYQQLRTCSNHPDRRIKAKGLCSEC
ncbi:hypothetical protein B0H12DRAFT_1096782 [Mycena haematopus]|nr:hypothetical protein B0H12DRAFT_1096782 [Mycena haematopus]